MVPGAEGKVVLQKETANRFCIFLGGSYMFVGKLLMLFLITTSLLERNGKDRGYTSLGVDLQILCSLRIWFGNWHLNRKI